MRTLIDAAAVLFLKRLFKTPEGRAYALAELLASEREGEGQVFEALERLADPELSRIVRRHADDERRHAALLEARLQATATGAPKPAGHPGVIARLGVLSRPVTCLDDALAAYAVLLAVEQRAASQYQVFARALRDVDPESATVLDVIAADEVRHVAVCRTVLERLAPDAAVRAQTLRHAATIEAAAFAAYESDALRFLLHRGLITLPPLVRQFLLALTAVRSALMPSPEPQPSPIPFVPTFTEPEPEFYREMRRRLDAWFSERGLSRTGGAAALAKSGLFGIGAALSYAFALRGTGGLWGTWALAMAHGLCLFLFALSSAHDACHGALVQHRWWNRMLWYCWDLAGASSWVTNLNHLRSHHVAPNVHGLDIAVGNEVLPLLRLHPSVPHRPWHRLQHVYFLFAYALATLHKWFVLDFVELARNSFGNRRGHPDSARQVAILLGFKLFVFIWAVVVPLLVVPFAWWQVAIGLVSLHVLPGALIGLTFQLTHIIARANARNPSG